MLITRDASPALRQAGPESYAALGDTGGGRGAGLEIANEEPLGDV